MDGDGGRQYGNGIDGEKMCMIEWTNDSTNRMMDGSMDGWIHG